MPANCDRCNGTGEYHGQRRDGTGYVGRCFACQGYAGRGSYRVRRAPAAPVPVTLTPRMTAFQATHPAEFGWLQAQSAAGVDFASSLLGSMARYGGLTPRQMAAVQRNLAHVEPLVVPYAVESLNNDAPDAPAGVPTLGELADAAQARIDAGATVPAAIAATVSAMVPAATLAPQGNGVVLVPSVIDPNAGRITIDMSRIFAAFDTAAASGLRKVRLTLGDTEFKRTGSRFRAGEGLVMAYYHGVYYGFVNRDGVFTRSRNLGVNDVALAGAVHAFRTAAADPQAAARAHGNDTGICSCCRRTLTDPPSVMAGIGPRCIERFFPVRSF